MKENDEYIWENYTKEYSWQLNEMITKDNFNFFVNDYEFLNNKLEFKGNFCVNWKELYNIIYNLKPKTIFECGFGGCYHLKNINFLCPKIKIYGCDLLESQLEFGKKFSLLSNEILNNLIITDFSAETLDERLKKYDFVYSQAVIMHLNTIKARQFLKNMGKISKKYIFIVEGINNHENFHDMVKECLPNFNFNLIKNYDGNPGNTILMIKKQ